MSGTNGKVSFFRFYFAYRDVQHNKIQKNTNIIPPNNVDILSGISRLNTGWAVVTESAASLWTDGRYFLQAEQEMDCDWILMRIGIFLVIYGGYPHPAYGGRGRVPSSLDGGHPRYPFQRWGTPTVRGWMGYPSSGCMGVLPRVWTDRHL